MKNKQSDIGYAPFTYLFYYSMKHYLRRILLFILAVVPLTCLAGDLLGSYTMNINDTKTLYLSSSMQSILKHTTTHWGYTTWTSSNNSVVRVTSQGKTSCTIQVVGYVSGQIKIEYDVYWADAYYNYVHSKDYYYITVQGGGSSQNTKITISASPSGGEVYAGSLVTLSTNPTGANIYYTLDGTTPTTSSNVYSSFGITIDNNCTLKAVAKKSGYTDSNVLTAYYSVAYNLGHTITAKTTEGIDMTFKVTSTSPKTCEVYKNAISKSTIGKVTIPSEVNGYKVTNIGYMAFNDCSNLSNVTIPSSITSIEDCAFEGCSGLTSISIPQSVTCIGYSVFRFCM